MYYKMKMLENLVIYEYWEESWANKYVNRNQRVEEKETVKQEIGNSAEEG